MMSDKSCKICKASKKNGATLYNAPKEEHLRDEWSSSCGVTITKSSMICEKHFQEKDFYGRRKTLKAEALPTRFEGDRSSEAISTQIKTEPPEFVVVTSSNSMGLSGEPHSTANISIKEEPIDSFQSLSFINEDTFDGQTDNPIGTNEDGNNTSCLNQMENKILTCGRIIMEFDKNGVSSYRLVCSYCKCAIPTSDRNFWQKFIAHLTSNHDSKIQPREEESNNISTSNSNSEILQKDSIASVDEKPNEPTDALENTNVEKSLIKNEEDCVYPSDSESNGLRDANDPQSIESSDEDRDSCDETYEPKSKKTKKAANNSTISSADEIISFDHPDKSCVMAFLELLKDNAILWLPRQSIMKRFGEALTDVSTKFNESFPRYAVSKEQFRQSINRIKDLYHRSSNDKQKRRMKTSMYKMKYPEYFELCAIIEEKSKSIKQNCDLCQAVFYSPIDMQIHKVKRHRIGELPFKCQRCGYGFTCPEKLASHEQKHNRVKEFICEFCNQGFYFQSKLQAHLALHTDDSKQICEICGKKFPSLSKYRRHKLHHEAPKEKCQICGKLYFEKWTLSEHMKSHRNERHYKCDICGKKFNRREGVTIHKRGVHKIKTQTKRYVWVNRITNTSNNDPATQRREIMENETQNSNSNSSTISSTTNEQTINEIKPAISSNPNHTMFPLEILNSLLN